MMATDEIMRMADEWKRANPWFERSLEAIELYNQAIEAMRTERYVLYTSDRTDGTIEVDEDGNLREVYSNS